ncbi:MAG: hypothetical protein ACRD1Z_09355 [Vicinamibacteria bacterium]
MTCIPPPLLLADRVERGVLQPPDFGLEKPQVHQRRASVVVALGVLDARSADREDRHAAAVRATDLDRLKLAAADETEGAEE